LAGGLKVAVERARAGVGPPVKIEVEVDTLEELQEASTSGVDAVLLDNMSIEMLRQAVAMATGKAITEASGGITPKTAPRDRGNRGGPPLRGVDHPQRAGRSTWR